MASDEGVSASPRYRHPQEAATYSDPRRNLPVTTPQLTPEEIQALRECNNESFWYRCLPYAAVLTATTHVLVMRGFLRPHPKYGPLFKNIGASFLGYVAGKLSYQGVCREKIMKLENSPLADAMRRRQQGLPPAVLEQLPVRTTEHAESDKSSSVQSAYDYQPNYDIDTNRTELSHAVEDTNRPSLDDFPGYQPVKQDETPKKGMSYDELRRQNRDAYNQRMASVLRQDTQTRPNTVQPPPQPPAGTDQSSMNMPASSMYAPDYPTYNLENRPREEPAPPPSKGSRQRRNKYGDIIMEE